ncbi:hypothetical protein HYPSUDRAFT_739645 [Hypholoma sublateritium FD-334 SS-4]|uniref:Uncharacterized protein n=1 Tax=Hypholoma sublateritium (strain FD-334 SS-4) TaxID=945553 RepID=A0A0D2MCU3_HYPSF|nr:hypothetical protein HYPSUDRAFT_739645 [Hypholoma sublateritium FD-334 SS-4]
MDFRSPSLSGPTLAIYTAYYFGADSSLWEFVPVLLVLLCYRETYLAHILEIPTHTPLKICILPFHSYANLVLHWLINTHTKLILIYMHIHIFIDDSLLRLALSYVVILNMINCTSSSFCGPKIDRLSASLRDRLVLLEGAYSSALTFPSIHPITLFYLRVNLESIVERR